MPSNILIHRDMEPNEVHAPYSFRFNNAVERISPSSYSSSDIHKLAIQVDDLSIWMLISTIPTWKRMLLDGDTSRPSGIAGGDLTGVYPSPSVIGDSHMHTPGVSIPPYPTSLLPSGNAGGDLTGLYPNPQLEVTGVIAGLYTNASLRIDAKGRVASAQSNPLGESNTGQNLGAGRAIYANKIGTTLNFRSLIEEVNSGLSITLTPNEVKIGTPNLAKLTGATFTGPIVTKDLEVGGQLTIKQLLITPIFNAGSGSNWTPNAREGSTQLRAITGDFFLDKIQNSMPGSRFMLFLRQPGSANADITYASEYKFPQGTDRSLSNLSYAMDVLEVFVISSSFYYCKLTKNIN